MIEVELARKFIEQVTQYTDYNINIMNNQGIIIASRDSKRVGSFHEVAHYIVTGAEDMVVTSNDDDYPGVRSGINVVINIDGIREGVVGITGSPNEIKPIALITKMAIEAMLKYEKQQAKILRRQNRKEQFLTLLTHEEFSDPKTLRSIANQLNYSETIVRIPILCRLSDTSPEPFLKMIKTGKSHSSEDISFILDDRYILIFKTLQETGARMLADYKYRIADYLRTVLNWLREQEKECKFYIGSFQSSFSQYYYAYQHCKWLETTAGTESASVFFYDYTGRYVQKILPMNELQRMFNIFVRELDEEFKQEYLAIVGALISSNYNLVAAAKALFMHKNTLLYHYNKIKDVLNINPIASAQDRFFMEAFYIYLRKEH